MRLLFFLVLLFSTPLSAQEFKVGTTLSLTGAYALYGKQALHGMELAIEEINAKGGVSGRPVKLLVEDFGTLDLRRAVDGARKLISGEKVELLFPLIVEDSEVIVPITSRVPLFTVAVGCGARKCGFNMGPYHIRAAASHDQIAQTLVAHAKSQGVRHSCVIAAEATYFEAYGRYIEELLRGAGVRVTYAGVPLSNSEDYREIATKFKYEGCDSIFAWIPIGSSGSFYRRVRESKSQAQIYGIVEADDPGILNTAGSAADGVIFARFSIGSEEFQRRFQTRFGEPPSRPAIPAYDVVKLVLEAAGRVGTEPERLKAELVSIGEQKGTNGTVLITPEGERIGEEVELMVIRGGKVARVAREP